MPKYPLMLAAILTSMVGSTACVPRATDIRELRSPAGHYVVRLGGTFTGPSTPMTFHAVAATVVTRGQQSGPFTLYQNDWMDVPFDLAYSNAEWLAENVLRFRGGQGDLDTVTIVNQSGAEIPCLRINTADLLVLFDLPPGERRSFRASVGPRGAITAAAYSFDRDGRTTAREQGRQIERRNGTGALAYEIVLEERRIRVSASDASQPGRPAAPGQRKSGAPGYP